MLKYDSDGNLIFNGATTGDIEGARIDPAPHWVPAIYSMQRYTDGKTCGALLIPFTTPSIIEPSKYIDVKLLFEKFNWDIWLNCYVYPERPDTPSSYGKPVDLDADGNKREVDARATIRSSDMPGNGENVVLSFRVPVKWLKSNSTYYLVICACDIYVPSSGSSPGSSSGGGGYNGSAKLTIAQDGHSVTVGAEAGLVSIDNGNGFDLYRAYIDNGRNWDAAIPYIDLGTGWISS